MITIKDLRYKYQNTNQEAVKGISFAIARGEIFGFLGPSGAGKSTTQNILIKLLDGYEGKIQLYGKDLKEFGSELYEKIGVSFELPNHFLKLSAVDNLAFFQSLYTDPTRDIDQLLDLVGLLEHKKVRVENFSKGMKMRLNFARSLLNNGDILFLDEPTVGLDPVNAKNIKNIILEQKARGKTIFITTHNMQVADDLCDRVAFIVDGQIVEIDQPDELKLKHGQHVVQVEYYLNEQIETKSFSLDGIGDNQEFLQILKSYQIRTLHSQETTLEDVFIKVTGRRLA
ncbi:MAG: ABC transporter ATP-binding protein [Halanaerobiales bacterium]|nr:ABC transporter ATP-binding protein [Halanaerobiales bacterium]